MLLSPEHEERRDSFREFARKHIEPHAADWDRAGALPVELVGEFAAHGYLGALIPARYGGQAFDAVRFGLLNEEIGAACRRPSRHRSRRPGAAPAGSAGPPSCARASSPPPA